MSDIKVGSVWVGKTEKDYWLRVVRLGRGKVFATNEAQEVIIYDLDGFITTLEPKNVSELITTTESMSDDSVLLKRMSDGRKPVKVVLDMSVAIGDVWQARCDGTTCKVMDIEVDEGVTWVTTQSVSDEDAIESDALRDFFEGYRFVGRGVTIEKGTSILGVKHGHYHKDVSKYRTMDIYAICKVWNVEPSGCTHHALKKLLHAGERGVKDRITDLEQAIESIESLIALERMDIKDNL